MLALHNYEGTTRTFPPGFISQATGPWSGGGNDSVPESGPGWSFFALALPYLEQSTLHNRINFKLPIADPANQLARSTQLSVRRCPSDAWAGPVTVWPASSGLSDLAANNYVG